MSGFFFISMGLLELWGARTEKYKMNNFCPQLGSNLVPSIYETNSQIIALLDLIFIKHLKVDRVLPEFAIKINMSHVVDVIFFSYIPFY